MRRRLVTCSRRVEPSREGEEEHDDEDCREDENRLPYVIRYIVSISAVIIG